MKLSVNYWMLGGFNGALPVAEATQKAKELGYEAIELCYGAGELTPSATEHDLKQIRHALDKTGLPIASLCTGYYWGKSLSSPNQNERSEALLFSNAYIRAARALGTDAILIVPGSVDVAWDSCRPVVPLAQAYELSRQSLLALLPLAKEQKINLCIENVWNKFLTGPFEFASFLDNLDSPWVKAYFDVGNCVILGYPEHWIEVLGKRIHRVHFKNFYRKDGGGTLSDFSSSLLSGDVNWPAVLKALDAIGYDGYATAEMLVSEKGMPDVELSERVLQEMKQIVKSIKR